MRRRSHVRRCCARLFDGLVHPRASDEPPWKLLPLVLALAFAARAAVALAGDFVLHPDEIMQYLEPAHRLAFGNGVVYWEYFYGARSWLVPGVVAGVLKLFDAVGLGQPWWYVGGVKLMFCASSLAIPAAMYWFARRHFGEAAARVALLAGAFWYELAGFAHKPMTEFVATAPLLALLALCVRPAAGGPRVVWQAAALAVLAAAIRLQYAPVALLLLGIVLLRSRNKLQLVLAGAVLLLAVGVLDALAWGGGLFHSYLTNLRFNLILGPMRANESPAYQFLWWLTLAGGGLSALCLLPALRWPRRYGLLLALIALVLLAHSVQSHKEYRFIFAVIPLWLLIGADLVARLAAWVAERRARGGPVTPGRGRGGRPVRGRIGGRPAQRAALPGTGVSRLVAGDRRHRLRAQSGPDLRRLPPSGAHPRRRRGVAGGPPLLQPAGLLPPAPRATLLRHLHRARRQPRPGHALRRGQPPRVRGPEAGGSRLLPGAGFRRRPHPAPRRGRAAGAPVARARPDHRRRPGDADHGAGRRGRPRAAAECRNPLRGAAVSRRRGVRSTVRHPASAAHGGCRHIRAWPSPGAGMARGRPWTCWTWTDVDARGSSA